MNGTWLGSRAIRTNWASRKPPAPIEKPGESCTAGSCWFIDHTQRWDNCPIIIFYNILSKSLLVQFIPAPSKYNQLGLTFRIIQVASKYRVS